MNIIFENKKMGITDSEEFENAVNSSGRQFSSGIVKIKDRYQHSFKLLKMLVNGEMNITVSLPETYWNY